MSKYKVCRSVDGQGFLVLSLWYQRVSLGTASELSKGSWQQTIIHVTANLHISFLTFLPFVYFSERFRQTQSEGVVQSTAKELSAREEAGGIGAT